jgi:hypothetical protein
MEVTTIVSDVTPSDLVDCRSFGTMHYLPFPVRSVRQANRKKDVTKREPFAGYLLDYSSILKTEAVNYSEKLFYHIE